MNKELMQKIAVGAVAGFLVFELLKTQGKKAVALVNPADPENIVNQATSGVVKTVSRGRFLSLGDFLFNVFNPNAPGESGKI